MENARELGVKIRSKRIEKKLSLKELATLIDKTPSFLSQVERGLAEPSITSLRKIANALEVPIFYFLLNPEEHNPVVRRKQRKILSFPGYSLTFELLSPNLNQQMEMIQGRLKPGAATCDKPLTHLGEECTVVLAGTMEIQVGSEKYTLTEGDCIYYFASIPHKITNIGSDELVFISSITPPNF
ncbi:MAG: helix-turn-helix domain-containing protein [Firmicutes bacterium]|nr:helix-turn-helix domain-containing protein [Bacillota bacterium]